jgi:hypothetical protein
MEYFPSIKSYVNNMYIICRDNILSEHVASCGISSLTTIPAASYDAYCLYLRSCSSRTGIGKMVSSGLLRRVTLVRTDVSEEPGTSFIRVTKIGELGTTQSATSNRRTLRRNWYFFAAYVGC